LKADREVMRFDEKSLDSALVYLQTAIDIMGDNAELFSAMANVYSQYVNLGVKQEDYLEKAREYAMKALALRPDLSSALCQLANLDNYEDYPKNILDSYRYYERALVANPTEIRALHGMAAVYEQVGKPPQALVFVERMERQDPLNPRRYIMRDITACMIASSGRRRNSLTCSDEPIRQARSRRAPTHGCSPATASVTKPSLLSIKWGRGVAAVL